MSEPAAPQASRLDRILEALSRPEDAEGLLEALEDLRALRGEFPSLDLGFLEREPELASWIALRGDYEDALWAPSLMSVHFGCDCGCGGDAWDDDSWDAAEASSERAIAAWLEALESLGFEWDLPPFFG